jgi:hypothetical protein
MIYRAAEIENRLSVSIGAAVRNQTTLTLLNAPTGAPVSSLHLSAEREENE